MILFLDRLLDVVCTYYCVARVTCLGTEMCCTRSLSKICVASYL